MAWVIYFPVISRWMPEIIGAPRDVPEARRVLAPDIPTWKRDLSYRGTRLEPHEVRREFWLHGSHRDFGDVFPVCAYWGCTAEWRQAVEALEPGLHQFFPIVIRRARSQRPIWRLDGREAVDGDFFLFNCLQLLDAVLVERSSGHLVKRYEDGRLGYSPNSDDLCVSKAVVSGRHIWLDGRYLGDAHFFVSDKLMERFRSAGFKGFVARPVREE